MQLFNTHVHKLQHQVVRDLAWCCFSAPMMQELPGSDAIILPFHNDRMWPWLFALDQQPDALIEQIAQVKSTRLGIYYETLWRFYFSHHADWELLNHNFQIERKGITLGAFDFLCRRGDEYWHIETAVKFYLCKSPAPTAAADWHHWVGPSSQDRLDLKLTHLRQHQLPLHQTPEAIAILQSLYPEVHTWKTGLCLQGYFFSPTSKNYQPAFSNKAHGSGCWWYLRDFFQCQRQYPNIQWLILARSRWLSPARVGDPNELMSNAEIAQCLQQQIGVMKRPLLLAALKKADSNNNYWQEDWRGFVVPDDWPIAR